MCSDHPFCPCDIALAMSLKKNQTLQKILRHTEEQQCGAGEVELEDAVDPCAFRTQTDLPSRPHRSDCEAQGLSLLSSESTVVSFELEIETRGDALARCLSFSFGHCSFFEKISFIFDQKRF